MWNKNKRKRDESSSSCLSTADSSDNNLNKNIKEKVRKLKRQLEIKEVRYPGRIENIPEFKGCREGLNAEKWLHMIDTTGDVYNWDSKA